MSEPLGHLLRDGLAVHTIPAGRPFLADLAGELTRAYAGDPAGLSRVTLYLPSRRAVREVQSAFLDARPGEAAMLLPRLRPLGDVDEEDLLASGTPTDAEAALAPAAEGVERRLVLARFLRRARAAQGLPVPGWPASLMAADELARLLDEFHTANVGFDALAGLVTDDAVPDGAAHWQHSLDFLRVVTEVWPAWLGQQGRVDGAARRRQLLDALAEGATDAGGPVIVAGSLGTIPATARFMARVAGLPRGAVVLPGLDTSLDDDAWEAIEPPHPQALFKALLRDHLGGLGRRAVTPWPCEGDRRASRRAFLSLILRPAEATDDWHGRMTRFGNAGDVTEATRGLRTAVARSEDEEAGFVALLMREALEEPGKTCTLVTPDRTLARRVRSKLATWDVAVDDSGGTPLQGTFRGTYLRAVARWLADPSDPVALCEVTAHPLCRLGQKRSGHERRARALNRALRGQRPPAGFEGLERLLRSEALRVPNEREGAREDALSLVADMREAAAPFLGAASTPERLQGHLECAQAMAATPEQEGEARLWRYEDGEGLAVHLSTLLRAEAVLPDCALVEYADVFDTLVTGPVVRPRGGHPRLAILGLLEARLQHADRIILAGLNEGVWPDGARADPFLSRPMRAVLGLASPEMIIGRAAHDFSQLAAHPEVWLTRSARSGRSPAEASRWMVRFESFARAAGADTDDAPRLRAHLASLHAHQGQATPASAPEPRPPVEARPRSFSISEVETLLRDPYAIYARRVLDLPALDRVDRTMDAAIKGTFYHAVFHRYAERWRDEAPGDAASALTSIAEELFEDHGVPASLRALWRPQMALGFEAFAAFDAHARAEGGRAHAEVAGEWTFEHGGASYTVRGRADRIDLRPDGTLSIVDYKTGSVPTVSQGERFNPQLALTALMARAGGFEAAGVPGAETYRAAFLDSLPSKRARSVFSSAHSVEGDEAREHVEAAERGFREWLSHFADPDSPYRSQPRAFMQSRYGDYDHLARRGEWAGAEAEAEGA